MFASERRWECWKREGVSGEVIVADNGSIDGSVEIARERGVRVVFVEESGYGCALMGGIEAARGKFVVMGDADDSYDFLEIPKFLAKLREGFDLVQGCRLPAGGGRVMPGAMPFTHRYFGNPFFTLLTRWWFKAPIHDVYCGLRGFTKSHYEDLKQSCTGMEFAIEMIIKSSRTDCRIAEVPVTLHPDGRVAQTPHLRTYRDGWRTLRFFFDQLAALVVSRARNICDSYWGDRLRISHAGDDAVRDQLRPAYLTFFKLVYFVWVPVHYVRLAQQDLCGGIRTDWTRPEA